MCKLQVHSLPSLLHANVLPYKVEAQSEGVTFALEFENALFAYIVSFYNDVVLRQSSRSGNF